MVLAHAENVLIILHVLNRITVSVGNSNVTQIHTPSVCANGATSVDSDHLALNIETVQTAEIGGRGRDIQMESVLRLQALYERQESPTFDSNLFW